MHIMRARCLPTHEQCMNGLWDIQHLMLLHEKVSAFLSVRQSDSGMNLRCNLWLLNTWVTKMDEHPLTIYLTGARENKVLICSLLEWSIWMMTWSHSMSKSSKRLSMSVMNRKLFWYCAWEGQMWRESWMRWLGRLTHELCEIRRVMLIICVLILKQETASFTIIAQILTPHTGLEAVSTRISMMNDAQFSIWQPNPHIV